jgi:hypothetical protein
MAKRDTKEEKVKDVEEKIHERTKNKLQHI